MYARLQGADGDWNDPDKTRRQVTQTESCVHDAQTGASGKRCGMQDDGRRTRRREVTQGKKRRGDTEGV
jgi:hypothetical protein